MEGIERAIFHAIRAGACQEAARVETARATFWKALARAEEMKMRAACQRALAEEPPGDCRGSCNCGLPRGAA